MHLRPPARRAVAVSLASAGLVILGCATNPATGSRELMLVSESQEIELGRQTYQASVATYGLVPDSALQAWVAGIGLRMAAVSERPHLPWAFGVLDDPVINAFAAPGGFVMVTRGLLTHINSEAELASVLGHEIGHVTARHSAQAITRQQLATVGLVGAAIVKPELGGVLQAAQQGLGLLFLKFGRDQESQSDMLGFRYMMRTRYDPREADDVFETLARVQAASGGSRLPAWASTHPAPEDRVAQARARLDTVTTDLSRFTVNHDGYLRRIDGLVYGENPRNGYFEGDRFYHPDLAFQLDFPSGWQHQNASAAVLAAPQKNDAIIELTLAKGTPQEAAREFFSQEGVQGQARATTVNGLSASGGDFQAQTQQGVLAGSVLFLAHGGRTFRVAAYGASAAAATYADAFRATLRSFRPVTDAKVLGVKPNRVVLQRAPSQMTLEEFNRRYPSVIKLPELALINGLEGGASVISAGEEVKRVVSR
ncbi:MAG TPA: M48 family metalloprotease [Gemmatimonadales bacterium]|nr:M48 family metalloprotease [Gemmatimonadales bacterium]